MLLIGDVLTQAPQTQPYSELPSYITDMFSVKLRDPQKIAPKADILNQSNGKSIPTFLTKALRLTKTAKFAVKDELWEICNELYSGGYIAHMWNWLSALYDLSIPQFEKFDFKTLISGDGYNAKLICRFVANQMRKILENIYSAFRILLRRVTEASIVTFELQPPHIRTKAAFLILLWSNELRDSIYDKEKFQEDCGRFASATAKFISELPLKSVDASESAMYKTFDANSVFGKSSEIYFERVFDWLPNVLSSFQTIETLATWYERLVFAAPLVSELQPFLLEHMQENINVPQGPHPILDKFSDIAVSNMKTVPPLTVDEYDMIANVLTILHNDKDVENGDLLKINQMLYDHIGYDAETLYYIIYGTRDLYEWGMDREQTRDGNVVLGNEIPEIEEKIGKITETIRLQREALLEWERRNGFDRSERESFGLKLVEQYIQQNYEKYDKLEDWENDEKLQLNRNAYLVMFKIGKDDSEAVKQKKHENFATFVKLVSEIQKSEIEWQNLEKLKRSKQPTRTRTRALIQEEIRKLKEEALTVFDVISEILLGIITVRDPLFIRFENWVYEEGYRLFQMQTLESFKSIATKFVFVSQLTDATIDELMVQMGELYKLKQKGDALTLEFQKLMDRRSRFTVFYFLVIAMITRWIFNSIYELIPIVTEAFSVEGFVLDVTGGLLNFISPTISNKLRMAAAGFLGAPLVTDIAQLSPVAVLRSFWTLDVSSMEFFQFYFTSITPVVLNLIGIAYVTMLTGARILTDFTTESWVGNYRENLAELRNVIQPQMRALGTSYSALFLALRERNETIYRGVVSAIPLLALGPRGFVSGSIGIFQAINRPGQQSLQFIEGARQHFQVRTNEPQLQPPQNAQTQSEHLNNLITSGVRVEVLPDEEGQAIVPVKPTPANPSLLDLGT